MAQVSSDILSPPPGLPANLEIRLHGRGGQGGVTCAKIIAAVFVRLGRSVQTFGDYAGERSGAPVRAYTRVSDKPIENRNKVYQPHHLLVLDPTLLSADVVNGLLPGGMLLLNTPQALAQVTTLFPDHTLAIVDATAIARRHKIGTRSVVIVNTTIAGAFVRALDIPLAALEGAYRDLGLSSNFAAAREAYEAVVVRPSVEQPKQAPSAAVVSAPVLPLEAHVSGAPTGLKTGNWRTQTPRYAENVAPCSAFCPAGNDVVGFIQAMTGPGHVEAAAILGRTTPFSAVCGRVCPAPCMDGCNRAEYDGSVNIRALERLVSSKTPVAQHTARPCEKPKRVAVVGGGPAGLAAAYALACDGHKVTVVEGEKQLGGVLRTGIPTYRLPRAALDEEVAGILRLGVETRCGTFLDRTAVAHLAREFDGVILATGLQKLRGVDGTRPPDGVEQGIQFLHRVNLEGPVKVEGHVVVLGGGNTAMDCARSALRAGASKVTVAYRRTRQEMPAIRDEVDQAIAEGIHFVFLAAPVGFEGQGRVTGVVLAEVELGAPDDSGRRAPVVTSRRSTLACDRVLLALGQSTDLSLLPEGWKLEDGRVSQAGATLNVFAAGDLATGDGTVAHAIGDGRRAATRVLRALGVEVPEFTRPDRARAVPATDIRFDHFMTSPPAHAEHVPAALRVSSFDEVEGGLLDTLEAHRCFSCGHCTQCDTCLVYCPEGIIRRQSGTSYEVDYSFCKGCGICVSECPRKAMEMTAT
jgi:2-oxoacid:acceptor oxidoreductase gamma subunit (pyruvate/2-ketoisovalerate family)/2-oxoacid:acceptor oxidoreductase delta subunit (pyruvate/2-ketoisovalerate family)